MSSAVPTEKSTDLLPDPEAIRVAIDKADERARLLRRLLRLALKLRLHLTTADRLPAPPKGVRHAE